MAFIVLRFHCTPGIYVYCVRKLCGEMCTKTVFGAYLLYTRRIYKVSLVSSRWRKVIYSPNHPGWTHPTASLFRGYPFECTRKHAAGTVDHTLRSTNMFYGKFSPLHPSLRIRIWRDLLDNVSSERLNERHDVYIAHHLVTTTLLSGHFKVCSIYTSYKYYIDWWLPGLDYSAAISPPRKRIRTDSTYIITLVKVVFKNNQQLIGISSHLKPEA